MSAREEDAALAEELKSSVVATMSMATGIPANRSRTGSFSVLHKRKGAAMTESTTDPSYAEDAQSGAIASRLNWLRAGVMGANDGIVSTAGMVVGVAGAEVGNEALIVAGIAAVVAGALSMAVGEYVSVSSQRDSERAELDIERAQLAQNPDHGLRQLTGLIQAQGIDGELARKVALQLSADDPLAAHARLELGINPDELSNPWHAGLASMLAFIVGGLIPLAAILLTPRDMAVPVTAVAVIIALAVTGSVSAHLGRAPKLRAMARTVGGGILAMAVTYGIGTLVGTQI
ncbi:VIT1/CCC1 transporter family protein [Aerolutibacter ruishenii]|uniref:VIT1/CCC1 family predicted Fe2+/Mn2+ transporter n=1 Tax=Aerolutibacter ruishenii TaxID=686800 RepID=A0A562LKQ9_9GAMM|nr:VIT1/CCC1 transporter family protein [Lysobacter ruishenii]TWI08199.1 VIT1/CCC1 family predicted Fe2+/Mn2+ transporter [Lysobacter ruishenii]